MSPNPPCKLAVSFISLLLAGDIESNPGPVAPPMYPCAVCQLGVNWSHQAVACEKCDVWIHKSCASMDSATDANMENCDWKCYGCKSNNCSSFLYHAYNLNVSNSFPPLAGIPGDNSIFLSSVTSPTSPFDPPTASSTVTSDPATCRSLNIPSSASSCRDTDTSSGIFTRTTADNIRITVVNANSVKGKKPEIVELCNSTQLDIMVITETKIDSTINSSEFLPQNYNGQIRRDRNRNGGGIMIAVQNGIVVDEVTIEHLNSEIMCTRISIAKSCPLYVLAYYRPPGDQESCDGLQAALYDLQTITTKNPKACVIAAGDFNARDIEWDTLSVKDDSDNKTLCERIITTISENQLHQLQHQPTRKDVILDLFCISNPSLVKSMQTISGISDHNVIILADIALRAQVNKKPSRTLPIWSKANWDMLKEKSWTFYSDFPASHGTRDIHQNCEAFNNHMQDLRKSIPSKKTSSKYNLPWLSSDVKRMCRKKRRLYRKARCSKDHWAKFYSHQETTRTALLKAHWEYVNSILLEDLDNGNKKSFWSYFKAQKRDNVGVSPLHKGRQLLSDSKSKAQLLSDQFKISVHHRHPRDRRNQTTWSQLPRHPRDQGNQTTWSQLTPPRRPDHKGDGVLKLLQGLNPSKASGPDEIPARLLKNLVTELTPAITEIFRQLVVTGALPESWKQAWISPVYKKGNRNDPAIYRPVSLTCILCKTLEHIFCMHIRGHLDKHGILTPANHGFRAQHSCETQLLMSTHDILRHRDVGDKWISPSLTSVRPLILSPTEGCLVSWNITVSVAHPWSGSRNSYQAEPKQSYVTELDQAVSTFCLESHKAQCSARSFSSSISMRCLLWSIPIPNVDSSPMIASSIELLTA